MMPFLALVGGLLTMGAYHQYGWPGVACFAIGMAWGAFCVWQGRP